MEMQNGEMSCDKDKKGCCKHKAIRALIAVIVVLFVFWSGVQFGEIRALTGFGGHEYGYRGGMMQRVWNTGGYGSYGGYPGGMMQSYIPVQTQGAASLPSGINATGAKINGK